MARIGKREREDLGVDPDADEPLAKSTRRGPYGLRTSSPSKGSARTAPPPEQQPSDPIEPSLRECASCSERLAEDMFPSFQACTHEADICRECFSPYVAELLDVHPWDRLICPSLGCATRLAQGDLQQHLTADVFERYERRAFQAAVEGVDGYFNCHSATCDYGHIHDDEGIGNNIWRCRNPACDARICTLHNVPFHTDETCAQYDARKADELRTDEEKEAATEAWIAKESKACPNSACGYRIQKNRGCDHMTCRKCRHEFCWLCFAPYRGKQGIDRIGNEAHKPDCQHYRRAAKAHQERDQAAEDEKLYN